MTGASAAISGALIGAVSVLASQWLGLSWQHRRWVLEQKQAEYREMLLASAAFDWCLQCEGTLLAIPGDLPRAAHALWGKVSSRVFTNDAIVASKVVQRLDAMTKHVSASDGAGTNLHALWFDFHKELRMTAQRDLRLLHNRTEPDPPVTAEREGANA